MLTQLLSVMVGAGLALIGSFLTNRANTARLLLQLQRERDHTVTDLRRSQAEELYVSVDAWISNLTMYLLEHGKVMKGELTYDQVNDLAIERGSQDLKYDPRRIEMIIRFYFPTLLQAYEDVTDQRDLANRAIAAHKAAYRKGRQEPHHLEPLVAAIQQISESGDTLLNEIVAVGQCFLPPMSTDSKQLQQIKK